MATPLKLKSERVGRAPLAAERPYLSVLVDTGVFHLDQTYDYSLPAKFNIEPGQWVSVPFNGRNCQGLVVERKERVTTGKVLPINRRIKGPVISQSHLSLYKAVSERWASPIFDVLRFVLRNKLIENTLPLEVIQKPFRQYLQLSAHEDETVQTRNLLEKLARTGRTLLVIPEARFLELYQSPNYDVGLRGSILTPNYYSNVVILREESEHHYELKSPGFNTRDVALLRSQILHENLLFIGFSPSLEMVRLIEIGYVTYKASPGRLRVLAKPSLMGELIPSSLIREIRGYIGKGPILVLTPSKGYGLSISCAACRNISICDCGGKLSKRSKQSPPTCVICSKTYDDWRCAYCGKESIYLVGRGIDRIAEEFGRSFPNTEIHIATADKELVGEVGKRSIVLATAGAAPLKIYSALLVLDGLNSGADFRSEERFLSLVMRHSAMAKGNVILVERSESPFVNALVRWNPMNFLTKLTHQMQEVQLPPDVRSCLIRTENAESDRIYAGFLASIRDGRLPADMRAHLLEDGSIILFFSHKNAESALKFLFQYQKKRSIAGKRILQMRIDPYLLG